MATANSLPEEAKRAIVQALACYESPTDVITAVKQVFEIDVTRQQLQAYDPTKVNGARLGEELKTLFHETRSKHLAEVDGIAIAQRTFRLRALERMFWRAETAGNMALAADLLEQAAKEMGDAYTNRQKVEHSGGIALSHEDALSALDDDEPAAAGDESAGEGASAPSEG